MHKLFVNPGITSFIVEGGIINRMFGIVVYIGGILLTLRRSLPQRRQSA